MKKVFTLLSFVMLIALTANARQSWDFRKWSSATLSALQVDMEVNGPNTNWRNYEFDATKADQQHYWIARKMAGTLVTNDGSGDKVIKETEGINFGASAAKKLVIAYNHNNKGEDGGSFIWFNGKNETMTIPNVVGGQTLHIAVESHSSSEARGFSSITFNGTALTSPTGNFTPIAYTEYDVELPEGQGDLAFKTSNGCHIYYVIIGNGDEPITKKVGYLYYEAAGKGFEELPLYTAIKDMEGVKFESIKVDEGNPTKEQLMAYDAIVLDGSLPADNADLVAALKDNIQWQPTLSVNAGLAAAFGYGEIADVDKFESEMVVVTDIKKNWFSGAEIIDDVTGDGTMGYAITAGNVWPKPLVLQGNHATDSKYLVWMDAESNIFNDSVVAYVHNNGHNSYLYYGADADYAEGSEIILKNMLQDAIDSKSEIDAAPVPVIKGEYKEQESTITITNANKNAVIYYTTDGTEPTTSSAVYAEPIVFTTTATVKAMAVAEGYNQSEVVSFDVQLFHQAKAPVISVDKGGDYENAIVTITSDEDVDIYYNFTGETAPSSLYADAVVVPANATIYAYAKGKEGVALVNSEVVSQEITANAIYKRSVVAAHFSADKVWATLSTEETPSLVLNGNPQTAWANSSNYYFSWGKTAAQSYENVGDPLTDPETGDPMMDEQGNFVYNTIDRTAEITTNEQDPDWKLVSQGQVMIHQVLSVGKDVGNGEGYNPDRAEDLITFNEEAKMTANAVQCAAKVSGDKYTARIESTKKFQAPFNVITYFGTANANEKLEIQVSEDGENWETLGDQLICSATKRLWKGAIRYYNETKEVYVRVAHVATGSAAQIYDIYVMTPTEDETGIITKEAETTVAAKLATIKYLNGNKLVIKTVKGAYNAAGAQVK